ncbi:hypothetical protein HAX54_017213 [Datura stramonium]|uniref:Uncharacterized protein n=1 Tax=Datura stramonium TaxID=4076 RepID=A0ABS8UL09_DATST|nr:hypothetical protein [Datura stramonium]
MEIFPLIDQRSDKNERVGVATATTTGASKGLDSKGAESLFLGPSPFEGEGLHSNPSFNDRKAVVETKPIATDHQIRDWAPSPSWAQIATHPGAYVIEELMAGNNPYGCFDISRNKKKKSGWTWDPQNCAKARPTGVPINRATRFENLVGFLDLVAGESLIKEQILERFFIDLVAGESLIKERAAARFNDLVGSTDVVAGEPLPLLPRRFRKNRAWMELNKIWRTNTKVKGFIIKKVKGGYSVAIAEVSGDRADVVSRKLGFDGICRADPMGFSGGDTDAAVAPRRYGLDPLLPTRGTTWHVRNRGDILGLNHSTVPEGCAALPFDRYTVEEADHERYRCGSDPGQGRLRRASHMGSKRALMPRRWGLMGKGPAQ